MSFAKKYADYYDLIYKDKDYEIECDYLEKIIKKYSKRKPETILDLACGTGGHAICLAKRGYKITGVDISKSMLKIARKKTKDNNLKVNYYLSKMQNYSSNKKFDIVISMFSSIDLLKDHYDLKKTLTNICRHLKPGGVFIFDFWNGLIFLKNKYQNRKKKVIENNDVKINRISKIFVNYLNQTCRIIFLVKIFKNGVLKNRFKEIQNVTYFFPEEMKHYIEDNGLKVLKMYPFLKLRGKIKSDIRDIIVIAIK